MADPRFRVYAISDPHARGPGLFGCLKQECQTNNAKGPKMFERFYSFRINKKNRESFGRIVGLDSDGITQAKPALDFLPSFASRQKKGFGSLSKEHLRGLGLSPKTSAKQSWWRKMVK